MACLIITTVNNISAKASLNENKTLSESNVIVRANEEKGKWLYQNNNWYWLKEDGKFKTGWLYNNKQWYYLDNLGVMQKGWQLIQGRWYYLSGNGAMVTGWKSINSNWYYLHSGGDMAIGWNMIDGKWYYFNLDGSMATGWKHIDGKWYYLNQGGSMASGWSMIQGKWYYFDKSGIMVTNWKMIGREWYYFKVDGSMATNTIIDNWIIGENGIATHCGEEQNPYTEGMKYISGFRYNVKIPGHWQNDFYYTLVKEGLDKVIIYDSPYGQVAGALYYEDNEEFYYNYQQVFEDSQSWGSCYFGEYNGRSVRILQEFNF